MLKWKTTLHLFNVENVFFSLSQVTINTKRDSYIKSLTLGISTCKSLEQADTVIWKWCDDIIKCNGDVTCSPLTTSLRHLEVLFIYRVSCIFKKGEFMLQAFFSR